jgi:hypothetical protein
MSKQIATLGKPFPIAETIDANISEIMKKTLRFLFLSVLCGGGSLLAQSVTGVPTTPQNKIAMMEEFTGVRCTYCPDGHTVLIGLEQSYPDQVYWVSFHPNSSGLTAPYGADPDLRRTYPDAFYSTPYCGSSRFMPSAFINRRVWANERIQGRGDWPSRVAELIAEASPANVGVIANYDSTTKLLTVTAEVYYTATVTDANAIYIQISEDNITVAQQSGATGAYVQDKVFRESMTAQWGDNITTTTQGTLAAFTYTFDNTSTNYDMHQVKVTAYVENKTNQELYSGAQKQVVYGSAVGVDAPRAGLEVNVLPNPFEGSTSLLLNLTEAQQVDYAIFSLQGQRLAYRDLGEQSAGPHGFVIDAAEAQLAAGIYLLQVRAGEDMHTHRLVVQ